jgi:hypothetical protein
VIKELPVYIAIVFALTTIITLLLLIYAIKSATTASAKKKAMPVCIALLAWLVLQALPAFNGFFLNTSAMPPRFLLGVVPPIFIIVLLFATKSGRAFIDSLPLVQLTLLHTIRIPVELVLYWLFLNKAVPELMTFAGRNFDIIAGITAPVIAYLGFVRKAIGKRIVVVWNLLCIALLLNIVVNAVLAAPFPFQQFAFEQPNIAVLYFPFNWLPAFVVPVVLFAHLVAIRRLWR